MEKEEKSKAFLMYYEYKEYLELLLDDEKGKLLMALIEYAENGIEPDFSGGLLMCFRFIKTRIDRDNKAYSERCETNRSNGKKGGRPPKKQKVSEETEWFLKKPNESEKTLNINTNLNINKNLNNKKTPMSFSKNDASFDFQSILEKFNSICVDLPSTKKLSDTRKRRIKAAAEEIGGNFDSLFDKVQRSDFLTGRSGTWKCSFDWIMKPENLIKILEGNYDNKCGRNPSPKGSNPFLNYLEENDGHN